MKTNCGSSPESITEVKNLGQLDCRVGMQNRILDWLANGETGASSETMVFTVLDKPRRWGVSYPLDPADFNRCLKLVKRVPEIKQHFDKISLLCKEWMIVISNWDLLEKTFIDEVGWDWENGHRAPKTYELMKNLGL